MFSNRVLRKKKRALIGEHRQEAARLCAIMKFDADCQQNHQNPWSTASYVNEYAILTL